MRTPSTPKARIGIPIPRDYFQREPLWGNAGGYRSVNEIVDAIETAGGEAVLLFPDEEVPSVDGYVLPGGGDVDPGFYGQEAHPQVQDTDKVLDAFQIRLAIEALEEGKAVLGICRGMQVLNVAGGGTLIQHLENTGQHFPESAKQNPDLRREPVHSVGLAENSVLRSILGDEEILVNSLHHQAADKVADVFRVVAESDDGIVEGIEGPAPFQIGVQFHPEDLRHSNPRFQALFDGLVDSAARA